MEKLGVICKVDQPIDWYAGMVIVPKTDRTVRICCDFTRLNASVFREGHILPSVQHLLGTIERKLSTSRNSMLTVVSIRYP